MGVGLSVACFASAGTLIYWYLASPLKTRYSTVTDLRKRAHQHQKRNYSEPTGKRKGGF